MNKFEEMINSIPFKSEFGYTGINEPGHLTIGCADTIKLAEKYETPLFVFCESKLRKNYRKMKECFCKYYEKTEICYAFKSNSLMAVLRVLHDEGAYADVVSEGEYFKAVNADFNKNNIVVNGNNKSCRELNNAVLNGSLINVDSFDELDRIINISKKTGKKGRISIRVNPNIPADVIAEFATGTGTSKFGIDMDNGDAFTAFGRAISSDCCNVEGIHVHIGSQVQNSKFYKYSTEKIMDFSYRLLTELGIELKYVNMGGGFAIPFEYLDECDDIEKFAEVIGTAVSKKVKEYNMNEPALLIEPGGSISGSTGMLLLSVGAVKDKGKKKIAVLNGGGDIMLRATQGWYTYRAVCANKMNEAVYCLYDLAGPLCYEGDMPARNRFMPELENKDIVAFTDAGAYTVSLMNHYNCRLHPAIVMIDSCGTDRVIKSREALKDLVLGEE